jgi:hypothetical protein
MFPILETRCSCKIGCCCLVVSPLYFPIWFFSHCCYIFPQLSLCFFFFFFLFCLASLDTNCFLLLLFVLRPVFLFSFVALHVAFPSSIPSSLCFLFVFLLASHFSTAPPLVSFFPSFVSLHHLSSRCCLDPWLSSYLFLRSLLSLSLPSCCTFFHFLSSSFSSIHKTNANKIAFQLFITSLESFLKTL